MAATLSAIVTNENAFKTEAGDAGGTLSGIGAYASKNSMWSTPGNGWKLVLPAEAQSLKLAFGGKNGDNKSFLVRMWLATLNTSTTVTQAVGFHIGDLRVTLGPTQVSETSNLWDGYFMADTIEILGDATLSPPGMRIQSDTTGSTALLIFDNIGCGTLFVEVVMEDATEAKLMWSRM